MNISDALLKFNVVKSVKVPVKLGISAAISLALVCFLLVSLVNIQSELIEFRSKEVVGTKYIPTVYKIIGHTQVTRGLTNSKLNGIAGLESRIETNRTEAIAGYQLINSLVQEYGDIANITSVASNLRSQFESLNSRAYSGNSADVFQQYTDIVTQLRNLVVAIGDDSNLTLDPDLDTFYLMDYLVFKAHVTAEAYGVLRGRGAGIIASGNYSAQQLVPFAQILGSANSEGTLSAIESVVQASPELSGELSPLINDLRSSQNEFSAQIFSIIENNRAFVSSQEYFALGTAAIEVLYKGVNTVDDLLSKLLVERVNNLKAERNLLLTVSIALLVLAIYVFAVTIVSIVDSLKRTQLVLKSVADGDLSARLTVQTKDEFQELADSLNETQKALKNNIEKEAKLAAETYRIKSALDVADTAVMMADLDLHIIYVNESAQRMMDHRGETLKTALPKLDYKNLVGSNVDDFHKDPSHQRNLLGSLLETYRSEISVAGLIFNLTATPIFDDKNERLGTVIEWEDVTEERAKEIEADRINKENTRIKQALDNVTTNTMISDVDRNILYANKSVITMLKGREAELRVALPNLDVDNLIGANMDVFHKNPAHQKAVLEAMRETYTAEIQVANLHFKLTANPVYSDQGERIGSVVEWLDQTDQVSIQSEIDSLIKSASHGDLSSRIPLDGKSGFFATLSEGLNQLVEISERVVTDTARVFSALSHGDLTESIHTEYDGSFGELKNDANATVTKLTEIITQIREAASTVSTGADEIAQGNADLSQRTEEQASSLEETASSMEEMTSAVKSSADNANQANEIASKTQKLASSGGAVVQDAVKAMGEINESSKHIADIIGVIDEIAFQTNLLALNAAVEAARAGEQGRGFAVVASEVRNLAQRSAGAAKEIKDLIRDSVDKVTVGSELVNKSGATLEDIVNSVQKVSTMVSDISGSAHEQSSGIEQVNKAVSQMDEMTQQNAALVEEATAAGEAMAEQARKLMQQMAFFTLNQDSVDHAASVTIPKPEVHTKPEPVPTNFSHGSQGGVEVSDDDSDWEEF
jgi:methyl-accepting chemotaxis protein